MSERADESLLSAVGRDPEAARQLRVNLLEARRRLLSEGADPALIGDLDDVLAGRRAVRDLIAHDAFRKLTSAGMQRLDEEWRSLSADERAAAVRGAKKAVDHL